MHALAYAPPYSSIMPGDTCESRTTHDVAAHIANVATRLRWSIFGTVPST